MPGLHGPIQVIVMVVSGVLRPSAINTIVIFESKSPEMCACVVREAPPNLQVDELVHEPSMLCVIELDEQFFWRICELKTDIFACDSSLTQDWVVKGFPIIIIELSQSPSFWCGTGVSAVAAPATVRTRPASAAESKFFM